MNSITSCTHSCVGIVAGIMLLAFMIFASCKEEIGVEPVATASTLAGSVVDSTDSPAVPLPGAIIVVIPCTGGESHVAVSDSLGRFTVSNVPVFVSPQCYRIFVRANGYEQREATSTCNCTQVSFGTIGLIRSRCALTVQPDSLFLQVTGTGDIDTLTITMRNLSSRMISIRSIGIAGTTPGVFRLDTTSTILMLSPGASTSVAVLFTSTQLGTYRDTIRIFTDCSSFPYEAPVRGIVSSCFLEIRPQAITFPLLAPGDSVSTIATLRNPTNRQLTVRGLGLSGASGGRIRLDTTATSHLIPPLGTTTLRLILSSAQPGTFNDLLRVFTDCGGSATTDPVSGTVETPTCYISPTSLIFPRIQTNTKETTYVHITNVSTLARVRVDSVSISPTPPFSLIGLGLPDTLSPGESISFGVVFAPLSPDTAVGLLRIVKEGSCQNTLTVIGNSATRIPVYSGVLYRWLRPDNPAFEFKGWNFALAAERWDTSSYCYTDTVNPPLNNGPDSADFRFFDVNSGGNGVYLQASAKLMRLGSVFQSGGTISFTEDNFPVSSSDFSQHSVRCDLFEFGDVAAIRRKDGKFALVLVEEFVLTIYGYKKLNFSYIAEVTPNLESNRPVEWVFGKGFGKRTRPR